jgi:hypothetical protein
MFNPSEFPAAEIQFDKDANIVGSPDQVLVVAIDEQVTDLVIMSHGWNNDIADARDLYTKLAGALRSMIDDGAVVLEDRVISLAGVFWPSKKFAESHVIPGGAAAAASEIDEADVQAAIDELRTVFTDRPQRAALDKARGLVPQLEDKATAREQFAESLRSMVNPSAAQDEDGTTQLFTVSAGELMNRLAIPAVIAPPEPAQGGALDFGVDPDVATGPGGAAGLGSTLGGVLGAAKNLLNGITYYEMKARAGMIGERGLAPLITQVRGQREDLRVHLVGHSFGGRLVAAAANALPKDSLATMSLLQAAFSHYGFAAEWRPGEAGGFRRAITSQTVSGPIVITHTANDRAVGIAYAIASRIAGQAAAAVGDANDIYGGIGRNGAQKTPEAIFGELLDVREPYEWKAGSLHNLRADLFIKDHSDIKGDQVAYAILSAVATS